MMSAEPCAISHETNNHNHWIDDQVSRIFSAGHYSGTVAIRERVTSEYGIL